MLGIAACQDKLGQREGAQATYATLIQRYTDQATIVQRAKIKMAAITNAAGPLNLNFQNGIGTSAGWFIPTVLSAAGYTAQVKHDGCLASPACGVVIASSTPKPNLFGNVMQLFDATAFRSKTVRLRSSLRLEATDPKDSAQMWLCLDLPSSTYFLDNMGDRPVRSPTWTSAEIVAKVPVDANSINIGVMSIGKGRAWVDGMTFEVVSGESCLPHGSGVPSVVNPACAVVSLGTMGQGFSADAFRGKTVRLRAKLKMDAVDSDNKAQLWFRVDMPDGQKPSFFDNMDKRPVTQAAWTDADVVAKIDPAAKTIYIGLLANGKGKAWVDGITFEVVPDSTPTTDMLTH